VIFINSDKKLPQNIIIVDKKGLIFKGPYKSEHFYHWWAIKHLYRWKRHNIIKVIDDRGKISTGLVLPDENFNSISEKIKYIWKLWHDEISNISQRIDFRYADECRKEESSEEKSNIILGFGGGLFFVGMGIYGLFNQNPSAQDVKTVMIPIGGIILGIYGIILGLTNLLQFSKNKVKEIIKKDDNLELKFEDDTSRIYAQEQIQKYNIDHPEKEISVQFSDGFIVKNIDRFSYWPLLCQKLFYQ
jgi:hypothetical protein